MAFLGKLNELAKNVSDKTSEFAKNVGDKTTEFAKNVGEKTNNLLEINRLNVKINSEMDNISEFQRRIGAIFWSKFQAGEVLDPEVMELCASIRSCEEAIEAARAEIAAKEEAERPVDADVAPQTGVFCPICSAENAPGAKFCKECGSKLEAATSITCPACGTSNPANSKFCSSCGAPM